MKSFGASIVLLLLAAALGGWIYFNERGPTVQQNSSLLLRREPSQVQWMELARADGARLRLTRNNAGDGWLLQQQGVHAAQVPADDAAVQKLLKALRLVQSAALVETPASNKLPEFGLVRPQSTLLLDGARLEFGSRPAFDAAQTYSRVISDQAAGGSQIALLPTSLAELVARPFNDWRDKSVLRVRIEDVSKVEISSPALPRGLVLVRTKAGGEGELDEWRIEKPLAAKADVAAVTSFLQSLPQTMAVRFLEDANSSPAKWGLDKPTATLRVVTSDGPRSLALGKNVGDARAAQNSFSKAVLAVPETVFGMLSRPLRVWRDKTVLPFKTSELKTLRVTKLGNSVAFERVEDAAQERMKWQRTDAEKSAVAGKKLSASANDSAATDIVFALQDLQAQEFHDAMKEVKKRFGFDRPTLEIELTSGQWSGRKTLQLTSREGKVFGRVAARGEYSPTVYELSPTALDGFQTALNVLFPVKKR